MLRGRQHNLLLSSSLYSTSKVLLCHKKINNTNATTGHENTMNGFGVMMTSTEKDPFVKGWIEHCEQSLKKRENQKEVKIHSALEIGCAFGAASLEALNRAHKLTSSNQTNTVLIVTANDIEPKHLKKVIHRFENDRIEEQKHSSSSSSPSSLKHHLRTWAGKVPEIFHQQEQMLKSIDRNANDTSIKYDSVLIANVLHFLTPKEVEETLSLLYKNHSQKQQNGMSNINNTKIFISLDSPFTKSLRPLLPWYYFKKYVLRSKNPGYFGKFLISNRFSRKYLIPERLRGMECYHVMEPARLEEFLMDAGWRVDTQKNPAVLFSGDAEGNPKGVSSNNGKEMVGVVGEAFHQK